MKTGTELVSAVYAIPSTESFKLGILKPFYKVFGLFLKPFYEIFGLLKPFYKVFGLF